jgi:hypothetical protein
MIRLPSYQRDYDSCWSGDPALEQPPTDPGRSVPDEKIAEYQSALEAYEAKLIAAQETGDWTAMIQPNQVPLKFVMCQVDRNVWRSIIDRGALPMDNPRWIGPGAITALLFRLALKDLVGAEFKVVRGPAPEWDGWVMAQADVVSALDQVSPGIVSEIGSAVYRRLVGISKKS